MYIEGIFKYKNYILPLHAQYARVHWLCADLIGLCKFAFKTIHVLLLTPVVADALEIGTNLIKIQRQTEVACGHRRHHGTSQGLLMHESRSNLIGLFRNVFGTAVKCQGCAVCSC